MLAAVLTTLLFSLSAIFGRRVSCLLGATEANLGRLGGAALLLGVWSHLFGFGIHGRAFPWLFISGCIGFGLGDLAMFQAYRRIGARRTVVLIQCLAAPFGTVMEWLWLGHAPSVIQSICGAVILAGLAIALTPPKSETSPRSEDGIVAVARSTEAFPQRMVWMGLLFGIVAAMGQAGGAVVSRKAYAIAGAAGEPFRPILADGINAAYQRMLGGIAVSICFLGYLKLLAKPMPTIKNDWKRGWPWLIAHAMAGPAAGVTFFQWALMLRPANIVLPIVATTPLMVLPLTHFFEGDPITRRAVVGGAIAVAGVIGLVRVT